MTENLESSEEKQLVAYEGASVRPQADFSSETLEAQGQLAAIVEV